MKKLMVFGLFLMASWVTAQAQETKQVSFYLKNVQWLPKKVTLISYSPNVTGNSTYGYILFPGIKKLVTYPIGTKLYVASSKQVGVVMSGNRIDKDPPFLIVSASDAYKIIKVN